MIDRIVLNVQGSPCRGPRQWLISGGLKYNIIFHAYFPPYYSIGLIKYFHFRKEIFRKGLFNIKEDICDDE